MRKGLGRHNRRSPIGNFIPVFGNLITESGDNLVQEDGSFILI